MPRSNRFFGMNRFATKPEQERPGEGRKGWPDTNDKDENLSGWAGIRATFAAVDLKELEEYSNDINTMLVFAGLFSSILTAFLVQTYPMLQADSADITNQLLALSLSAQLHATGTIMSDALNRTLSSLSDRASTSFSPSSAARWINALFFISLVLNFTAAFFSLRTTLWICEFLKWDSPLTLPRENVLIRQIRRESWEDWRVPTILFSIPVLLELGMVAFLAGVIILLWTLDDVVAIVVTVFVSLFLGIFAAFTVLPIFYRRCPYRSPTAWACLPIANVARALTQYIPLVLWYLARRLRTLGAHVVDFIKGSRSRDQDVESQDQDVESHADLSKDVLPALLFAPLASWRGLDLESIRITESPDLLFAARRELACEMVDLRESGTFIIEPSFYLHSVPDDAARAVLRDIQEVSHLFRALAWVQRSTQSLRVLGYINQCSLDVHSDLSIPTADERDWRHGIRMVTNWCMLEAIATSSNGSLGPVTVHRGRLASAEC